MADGISFTFTFVGDGALDTTLESVVLLESAVLTAWKEKSSSPTKLLTCLQDDWLVEVKRASESDKNSLHQSFHVAGNTSIRDLEDSKGGESWLGDVLDAQNVLVYRLQALRKAKRSGRFQVGWQRLPIRDARRQET